MASFLDVSTISMSDELDEVAALPPQAQTPGQQSDQNKGPGALHNTTSFARRLAHGQQPLERDKRLSEEIAGETTPAATRREQSDMSFEEVSQESISSGIKRNRHVPSFEAEAEGAPQGSGGNEATSGDRASAETKSDPKDEAKEVGVGEVRSDDVLSIKTSFASGSADEADKDKPAQGKQLAKSTSAPVTTSEPSTQREPEADNSNQKNPLESFGDYIAFFFQKAEVYEEELELRQSQRNLQARMDKTRHGASNRHMPMSPEGTGSSEDSSIDGEVNNETQDNIQKLEYKNKHRSSTPQLSDSLEAMAAVQAISDFRSLKDVKKQLNEEHSFDKGDEAHDAKKQKAEAPVTQGEVVDEATKQEWKEQWKSFVSDKKKNRFSEVAIESLALPMTVDEFCHSVLDDNATHSLGKFMCDIGELNVDTTRWEPAQTPTASEPTTRTIHYTHPVNAPMAPPTAKARKEQKFHKVGRVGLCVETCTIVEEVPMADCFVVEDRLWVNEADDGSDGCIVAVTFQIRFVKGTMFRRIIENTTRSEYQKYWNQFEEMIQSLQGPTAMEEEELLEVAMELEEATALLEGEGQEVPLSSVLSKIRTTSRRLSSVAQLPSTRKLISHDKAEAKPSIDMQQITTLALDGITFIRKQIAENDNAFLAACAVCLFMFLFNVMALRQMRMMNGFLSNLDARLEKMNEVNEMLLAKLASGDSNLCDGGSCSS